MNSTSTKGPPSATRNAQRRLASSAFDPRFKDALLRGRTEPYSLTFESHRAAARFQARMQAYRFALREEGRDPGLALLLYQVKTSLSGRTVLIAPIDSEFDSIFASIGSPSPELPLPEAPTAQLQPNEPQRAPTLEELFADLDSNPTPHDEDPS